MTRPSRRWWQTLAWLWLCCLYFLAVSGCAPAPSAAATGELATPTLHPYFGWGSATPTNATATSLPPDPAATPTVFRYFAQQELPTPRPTSTRGPTPTPRPTETPLPTGEAMGGDTAVAAPTAASANLGTFDTILVFDDELAPGWTMANSWDAVVDTAVITPTHSGSRAIAMQPEATYGSLFFNVTAVTDVEYLGTEILGVSFWLNPGDTDMAPEDLAVAVLGSNAFPHWQADDTSVDFAGTDGFSETRLYFLEFNRALPAGEWVEVVVWLDDLIYDPITTYITGFYLKTGEAYQGTFFVDDVTLLTTTP